MAKAKLEIRILDLNKLEAIKALFNEVLDTLETLRMVDCTESDSWDANEIRNERKGYIDRFADIITGE